MNNYYVYEWIRLDTNEPFYIGKGKENRAYVLTRGNNDHFNRIVNKIPTAVNILHDNLTEQEALELEVWYILEYRDIIGYDLCNICDGGEGATLCGDKNGMYGKNHTQESISKMSKTRKEKGYAKGENNPMFGKSLYDFLTEEEIEEWKRKESENNSRYWLGKNFSEEHKAKIGKTRKERGLSEAEANPFFGKHHTEETKQLLSQKQKELYANGYINPMQGKKGDLSPIKNRKHSEEELNKMKLNNPNRISVYCVELETEFTSLSSAEKYIQETYNISFGRKTLKRKLDKGEGEIIAYGEIIINNQLIKLHWKYI